MKTKNKSITRYNLSSHDLHPQLRTILNGRRPWKERMEDVDDAHSPITWTFHDGTIESYVMDSNGNFIPYQSEERS